MSTYTNKIEAIADQLNWSTVFVSAIANKFGISGASEASLSKAFNRTKELDATKTEVPLYVLLTRFSKMAATFKPFTVRLDDPDGAKQLLEEFEAGKLSVSVSRQDPEQSAALVRAVYIIEFMDLKLLKQIQSGEVVKTHNSVEAAVLSDSELASSVVDLLMAMGHPCRSVLARMRIAQNQITRSTVDLGFEPGVIEARND